MISGCCYTQALFCFSIRAIRECSKWTQTPWEQIKLKRWSETPLFKVHLVVCLSSKYTQCAQHMLHNNTFFYYLFDLQIFHHIAHVMLKLSWTPNFLKTWWYCTKSFVVKGTDPADQLTLLKYCKWAKHATHFGLLAAIFCKYKLLNWPTLWAGGDKYTA